MAAWIFQSSPAQYDLPAALDEVAEFLWLVNKYRHEIHAGDRVYLWETGDGAGILGIGRVLTEPAILEDSDADHRYYRQPDEFVGPRLRVRIAVDRVLRPRLLRTQLKQDPILADLANLKFAQGTNFPVTEEQDAVLEALTHDGASPRCYIAAISKDFPGTWERCKELGSWGSPSHSKLISGVQPGDRLLIWQGGRGFVATALATGPYHEVTPTPENEWGHGDKVYPHRFPLRLVRDYAVALTPAFPGTGPDPEFGIRTLQFKGGFSEITSDQYDRIVARLDELNAGTNPPTPALVVLATEWDLAPGDQIKRTVLHQRFGGNPQSGISPSAKTPNVLFFTDPRSGGPHGYVFDGWTEDGGLFLYTGEGQRGDQTLTAGNLAIAEHRERNRHLRLFEGVGGTVRYVGEFGVADPGYEFRDAPETASGPLRKVLVFRLSPIGDVYRSPSAIPPGIRWDLFDAAVKAQKAELSAHPDLHAASCRQLRAWLDRRDELSDEELWAGLRDRFLPFGHVLVDGSRITAPTQVSMSESAFLAAEKDGRVEAHGNLHWTGLARSVGSVRDDMPVVRAAIDLLLDDDRPYEARISKLTTGTDHVPGFGPAVWTALYAMTHDWDQPVLNETVQAGYKRLGWPLPRGAPVDLVAELRRRGQLLLAHSGLESLAHLDFVYWRIANAGPSTPGGGGGPIVPPSSGPEPTFEWLVAETLWNEDALTDLINTLTETTRQIVLAGPPGTSKTWVAKALARHLTHGAADAVRLVQFHPSYSYEQFIEGLRPVVKDGAVTFERVDGVVLDLVGTMAPGDRRILVIDEMNRANLPRVLGELMYLFEYRDEEIALQYSPTFTLPEGLLFVGTMNTADRSIRSIDVALRRRFDVFECPPDIEVLRRYYAIAEHSNEIGEELFTGLAKLNEALAKQLDRHHTIGHTFFMAKAFDGQALQHAWDHKIGPLIEEYFFDQPDLAAEFTVGQFWPSEK